MKAQLRELDYLEIRSIQEPSVIKCFEVASEGAMAVDTSHQEFVHPEYDFLRASVDGLIGDDGIFEAKTSNEWMKDTFGDEDTDNIPTQYYLQVQHYMLVTGRKFCYLGVLIGGDKFKAFYIPRDEDICMEILRRAKEFWYEHVLKKIEPPFTANDDLDSLWVTDKAKEVIADDKILQLHATLRELQAREKGIAEDIKNLKAELKIYMEDAGVLTDLEGKCLAKMSLRVTQGFDSKRFEKEHPDLFAQYMKKPTESKVLLIRG